MSLISYSSHTRQGLTPRTCLRMIILGITRRPVLTPAVPQREFDITSLSPSIISEATKPTPSSSSTPAIESISPGAPLRSHLYQMSGSLPESYLPHPLTLMPEMTTAAFAAEILTSTATLVQVLLLLKTQVRILVICDSAHLITRSHQVPFARRCRPFQPASPHS